jgi:predicted nucleic acid-binding protein/predicted HTH domain antitoxin
MVWGDARGEWIEHLILFRCKISWKNLADFMALHFDIPESITCSLRLPEQEMEPRLRAELAVALYSQGLLAFGKATELAGISRFGFADLLGRREIPRHYTDQELTKTWNMLAVSNTSPISNLASIGRLELLKSQFSALWIPDAVVGELAAHPDPIARAMIQTAVRDQLIRTATPRDSALLRLLILQLHRGEAEAIALATDLKASIILIDEQEGRRLASETGLAVTGVLGVLLRAKRGGEIPAVKPEMDLLRSKANFFVSSALEIKVLAAAGE